jgi:hypothetical protein
VVFEALGRMVNFKNWRGDYSDNWKWNDSYWSEQAGTEYDSDSGRDLEHGKMWHYTITDERTNGTYEIIGVNTNKPATSNREAEINLNGFSFRIGLRIKF